MAPSGVLPLDATLLTILSWISWSVSQVLSEQCNWIQLVTIHIHYRDLSLASGYTTLVTTYISNDIDMYMYVADMHISLVTYSAFR